MWVSRDVQLERFRMTNGDNESHAVLRLSRTPEKGEDDNVYLYTRQVQLTWKGMKSFEKDWAFDAKLLMARADKASAALRQDERERKLQFVRQKCGTDKFVPRSGDYAGQKLRNILDKKNRTETRRKATRKSERQGEQAEADHERRSYTPGASSSAEVMHPELYRVSNY